MPLTRREELARMVKVKLDELSPFDNLGDNAIKSFIADVENDYKEVNPISSYIEATLDKAANYCMNDLPLSILVKDTDFDTEIVQIDPFGIGHIFGADKYLRLIRVSVRPPVWGRDVTSFITSSDPDYMKQQSRWTRGGMAKPVVAIVPERQELEFYSFAPGYSSVNADVYYIDCDKSAENVLSDIDDYIALRCASYILEILGEADKAGVLMTEYENKKKGLIQ